MADRYEVVVTFSDGHTETRDFETMEGAYCVARAAAFLRDVHTVALRPHVDREQAFRELRELDEQLEELLGNNEMEES